MMAELKRKRTTRDGGRPKKRAAAEAQGSLSAVKLKVVTEGNEDWRPIVGTETEASLECLSP